MERREFLKKSLALGFGIGVLILPKGLRRGKGAVFPAAAAESEFPDIVAVRGASPDAMFDRGIAALGGMQRFVRQGQTVLLKPNISWDVAEDGAANSSPALIACVARRCLEAGARRVVVMDHSIEHWESSLNNSGISAALKSAGAVYAPAEQARYYQRVDVGGQILKETLVHEAVLECDVLIDIPVLKHHGGTGVSIAIKNLMGCVWDRRAYHADGLNQCIADFLRVRKPDLCVVDAHRVIVRHGPRGGSDADVSPMNAQILSADIVAADTAAAKMLGREAADVGHIRAAAAAGFGESDLTRLKIERLAL